MAEKVSPINTQALYGQLYSPTTGPTYTAPTGKSLGFQNSLVVPLLMYAIQSDGSLEGYTNSGGQTSGTPAALIQPNTSVNYQKWTPNCYVLFLTSTSGSFVTAYQLPATEQTINITMDMLINPNAIGAPPEATSTVIIPPDSPRVLVGCGKTASNYVITREQFWRRMPDSYSIPPTASKTISLTQTSGRQDISSSQENIAKSLGVSASAGWGPISASVSANLSKNTSSFQQVTVTSETSSYTSDTIQNTENYTKLYIIWQLCDVITIFDNTNNPAASLITSGQPSLILSYNLDNLLNPPANNNGGGAGKSDAIRAQLSPEGLTLAAHAPRTSS